MSWYTALLSAQIGELTTWHWARDSCVVPFDLEVRFNLENIMMKQNLGQTTA